MTGIGPAHRHRAYIAAAIAFTAYAIWGALLPFRFERVPLATAVRLMWTTWSADPRQWSITDLVSNVLLFVPVGLFVQAARDTATGRPRRALPVWTAAVALSWTLEFAQAFVLWRTPSMLDVATDSTGAALGIALWRTQRARIDSGVDAALERLHATALVERLLLGYCAIFAIAWLLPLDLTISASDIADKFHHSRLLAPFEASPDAATLPSLCETLFESVPLGVAAVRCRPREATRSLAAGVVWAAAALTTLEAAQIFVFSRTTDATELVAAVVGSTIGAALCAAGVT